MNLSPEVIVAISTSAASIAAAIVSVIKAFSAAKKAAKLERLLEDARARSTYTICPHCKEKLYLTDLSFFLPSGSLDNNLDGIPDRKD